jgi:hypothetical protein
MFDRISVIDHHAGASCFHNEQVSVRVGKEQGSPAFLYILLCINTSFFSYSF